MPARLDFKAIAESVDIFALSKHLNVTLDVKHRGSCPACGGDRTLELKRETNSFVCYRGTPRAGCKYLSGDSINLYQHAKGLTGMWPAAKALSELFLDEGNVNRSPERPASETSPQKPEAAKPSATPATAPARKEPRSFDGKKFAGTLAYDERVHAMELSEDAAKLYRIGTKRNKLFLPICPPDVEPAGWAEVDEKGNVRLPDKWLQPTNVVRLVPKTA